MATFRALMLGLASSLSWQLPRRQGWRRRRVEAVEQGAEVTAEVTAQDRGE